MALTRISSDSIQEGAITPDLVSASFSNTFATTANVTSTLTNYATTSTVTSIAESVAPKIASIAIANSTYSVLDDTAVALGGGYIVLTGVGFASGAQVLIDGTPATSTTFVSSTTLRAQVPAKSAASYTVYVVNTDGGTGIRVNGLTYSAVPTWSTGTTLDPQAVDTAFAINLSASGASTYSNTSALPSGTTLLSNGYFYGTVTGISEQTTYSFTVRATDAELQDADRTFSVTVTVTPEYFVHSAGNNAWGNLDRGNFSNYYTLGITDFSSAGNKVIDMAIMNGTNALPAAAIYLMKNGQLRVGGRLGPAKGDGTTNTEGPDSEVQIVSPWNANNYKHIAHSGGASWAVANTSGVYVMYPGYSYPMTLPLQMYDQNGEFPVSFTTDDIEEIKTSDARTTLIRLSDGRAGVAYAQFYHYDSHFRILRTDASQIAMYDSVSMVLTTSGALFAGYASDGKGPFGPNTYNMSYFNVLASNVAQVSASKTNGYYVKTDGTLWGWGENYSGAVGQTTPDYGGPGIVSSPIQIGSDTNWQNAVAGYSSGWLKKTSSDTLWVIGQSSFDNAFSINQGLTGYPRDSTGDPIYSNETSIPVQAGRGDTTASGTVPFNNKKFRGSRSFTMVLSETNTHYT